MSDQPNTPEDADSVLRPTAEQKRTQETVMLNSDSISDLVNEAKGATAPAPDPAPAEAASSSGTPVSSLVIGVVAVAVIAAMVVVVLLRS